MKKRFFGILLSLALLIGMMPALGLSQTAYADNPDVTYLDEKGETKTLKGADYEVVSSDGVITWGTDDKDTWYVVKETVDITDGVLLKGNVNLVLCNGATLNVGHSIGGPYGNDFTIYAQSTDENTMGGLITHNAIKYGNVTINGGKVETAGYCGIEGLSNVTINGGVVTATGENDKNGIVSGGNHNGAVRINGGKVIASGGAGAISGTIINSISGTAWTNTEGTEGKTDIPVSTGASLSSDYKKAQFPAEYPIWVGGKRVTSANANDVFGDGKVSFTPATEGENPTPDTLTLKGASISGGHTIEGDSSAAIYYEDENNELIINVTSDSTVTGPNSSKDSYTIYSKGNLTINGNGSLTAIGGTPVNKDFIYGVWSEKALTVNGTLIVNVNDKIDNTENRGYGVVTNGIVVNKNGTLTATGTIGIGNSGGPIIVEGKLEAASNITSEAEGKAISFSGSDGITVTEGAELIANGGEYGIDADGCSITINEGAKLSATGKKAITGTVKNAIVGTGWDNANGTGEGTKIAVKEGGQTLGYKKVVFPPLPADAVKYLINDIPTTPATTEGRAAVSAAREAYDKLEDVEKDEITASQLEKLMKAEETIRQADLTEAKSTAKGELDTYRKAKVNSAYDEAGIAALNTAKIDGDTAIESATTTAAVTAALNNAKAAIDAVQTIEQKNAAADKAAADAVIAEINRLPEKDKVKLSDRAKIEVARQDYDALTDDQKKLIDSVTLKKLTDAEEGLEAAELADRKVAAKNSLQAHRNSKANSDYDEAGIAALNTAKTDGDTAIDSATNKEAVDTAFQNALRAVDAVKTKAQKQADDDQAAADAVVAEFKALPAKGEVKISDKAKIELARAVYEALTDDQKDLIKASEKKKLTDAEKALAAIELVDAKAAAKDSLAAYRNAKNNSAYDDAGRAALDKAKADGDRAIDRAKDLESVAEALADAKTAMDAVNTKSSSTDTTPVGSVHNVSGSNYIVTSAGTVSLTKAPSRKSFTIPAAVGIAGKTFNVTGINAGAFAGTKEKTLIVKSKDLTKASVKGSLKGSKIKTVKVKVGKKKENKKFVKKYKKIFTKKNCGKKVRITR